MSKKFEIKSSARDYTVELHEGKEKIEHLITDSDFVIYDKVFDWIPNLVKAGFAIEAIELNKSYQQCGIVLQKLRSMQIDRASKFVVVGGGIIQDIGTFVTSIYMRGLNWTYVPTTLLAMCDSCIGGKSSINHGNYKNIIGNFHPPSKVEICIDFTNTLSKSHIAEGYFEAMKINFARGEKQFHEFVKNFSYDQVSQRFDDLVLCSLKQKKIFIEKDEHDEHVRLLLNFGHTFGHAVEAATDFAVPHGIAVGQGMLAATRFIQSYSGQSAGPLIERLEEHIRAVLRDFPEHMQSLHSIDLDRFTAAFSSDKKHSASKYCVIVPDSDGALRRLEVPRNDYTIEHVRHALHGVSA